MQILQIQHFSQDSARKNVVFFGVVGGGGQTTQKRYTPSQTSVGCMFGGRGRGWGNIVQTVKLQLKPVELLWIGR